MDRSDESVTAKVEPIRSEPPRVTFDFAAEGSGRSRYACLQTSLALPDAPVMLTLRVPEGANRPPFDRLYGIRVRGDGFAAFILFGDDVGLGRLPTGEPFTSVASPRELWHDVRLDLRAVLDRLHVPLLSRRFSYGRARDVDVPSVPIDLCLFTSVPQGVTAQMSFGAIVQDDLRPVDAIAARGERESAGVDAWHGAFEIENGNYDAAVALLERAVAREPSGDRFALLGNAQYLAGRTAAAVDSYHRALEYAPSAEVERALGWALVATGDFDGALACFTRGHDAVASIDHLRPLASALAKVRDLAVEAAKRRDCSAARVFAETAAADDATVPLVRLGPCDRPNAR
jgi:hypothetical protein